MLGYHRRYPTQTTQVGMESDSEITPMQNSYDVKMVYIRLWVLACSTVWGVAGIYWGRIEIQGILLFGIPIWICAIGTLRRIRVSRSLELGYGSIVGTSSVSLLILLTMCSCSASNTTIAARGQTPLEVAVVQCALFAWLLLIPLTAWSLSTTPPSGTADNKAIDRNRRFRGN